MQKQIVYQHPNRFVLTKDLIERPTGVSCTRPGEAYTIRQLMDKAAVDMLPPVSRQGMYDGEEVTHEDPDMKQLLYMDLAEQDEAREELTQRQESAREQLAALEAEGQASTEEVKRPVEKATDAEPATGRSKSKAEIPVKGDDDN